MSACDHGHIQFERGLHGQARCADCGADVTAREQRADHWRSAFDRSHPYEVSGPDGPVAQFSVEEWNGDRVCRCAEIVALCQTCQGDELAGHSDLTLSAWHLDGHPEEMAKRGERDAETVGGAGSAAGAGGDSMRPKRIQRRRAKGWRMPEGAVCVDRSTKWGNPFVIGSAGHMTREHCVDLFRLMLGGYLCVSVKNPDAQVEYREMLARDLGDLRGKDLACWCPLTVPCHADALIEAANGNVGRPVDYAKDPQPAPESR